MVQVATDAEGPQPQPQPRQMSRPLGVGPGTVRTESDPAGGSATPGVEGFQSGLGCGLGRVRIEIGMSIQGTFLTPALVPRVQGSSTHPGPNPKSLILYSLPPASPRDVSTAAVSYVG